MALSSLYRDVVRASLKLTWGPGTDPNKLAPPMAQYPPAQEWPDWCRVSSHGSHLVRVAFLDSLPRFMEGKHHHSSIVDQVSNIRLQRLLHYKCHTDWNHEFVRADLVNNTNHEPLVMVWERDLPLTDRKVEKQRGLAIKSGLPCQSIDRVTYITEDDFADFVKLKEAYIVRTADFPSPGPDILQVACVLETHSLSFPIYHVYSTMCYWYADSTFEVLVEMGRAKVQADGKGLQRKGVWSWGGVDYATYSGVTCKSLAENGKLDPAHASIDLYQEQLVKVQGEIVAKYDSTKAWSEEALARLPAEERQAVKQSGWNVAQFLRTVQDMPAHEKLLGDSIAREEEVREVLEKIQNGHEEQEAAAKREAEAKKCAEMEQVMAEQEDKWRDRLARERARADLAERRAEQERERADRLEAELATLRQSS